MMFKLSPKPTLRIATALAIGLASLNGCSSAKLVPPPGFAVLEPGEGYRFRAVSPEGVVVAVRREANDPKGDLGFWSGAIDAKLRRDGYRAIEILDVEAKGLKGKQLRYSIERGGRDHSFWVAVFVTEESVVTVESGGDHELFAKQSEALLRALASLDLG
jgi:hypothetical protein